jgi:hypothetical protein
MLFEVVETAGSVRFRPFYFRNDYVGVEHGAGIATNRALPFAT